ncbi:MAG: hypothetical protein IIT39_09355 [Clostridia bacterium]|nr:hypothetical protein [Clostridia bacterium]
MDFIDKLSMVLSDSLDYLIDRNRQKAQLNRIEAVIKNETEILNRAYIALGKHYYKTLDGRTEETDISQICDTIKNSKLRLKKAKARYEYIFKYGVPTPGLRDDISVAYIDDSYYPEEKVSPKKSEPDDEQDITIAVQK